MPGRVSSRSTKASAAVSHKSSVQTLNSRASTTSRISSPYVEIPEETEDNALRTQVSSIFRDAQRTTASHRKLVINLRKIQEACCYEPTSGKNKTGAEDFDEEQFQYEFTRCVLRVMPVKKSETVGERTVRFLGLFLRHANDKDNEHVSGNEEDETGVMVETPSTRLTSHVMNTVLPLLTSKEKFVRYRATQIISHIINSLDSIDDDLFQVLRHGLLKRIHDKEAMVRVQAVLGLGRLAGNDVDGEADDSDDDSETARCHIYWNELEIKIPPHAELFIHDYFLPLEISDIFRCLCVKNYFDGVFAIEMKMSARRPENSSENVGLRIAPEMLKLRRATRRLLTEKPSLRVLKGLLELLERIDVVNSGVENGVALEAMKGFWEGRPDYRDAVTFDDHFWDTLSAESVFMARSFNDFCRNEGNHRFEALIEEKIPEVTKLAFYLQRYIDVLVEALKRVATQEIAEEEEEDDTVEQEFIVEQLLHIAQTLDYSDEVGRRKMFALLRQSLSVPDLPEEVTKLTLEVLRGICAGDAAGEREFCSIVLEAVADVHDTITDSDDIDDSFHSAKSEVSEDGTPTKPGKGRDNKISEEEEQDKAIREIMVNMKCLHIVQCMLENIEGNLQQNTDLVAMLNNLVVPAVRSHEAPVRERGLLCLGLCCLLDKSLAEENLGLFMHFFTKGHSALQITALQVLTDVLNQHGAHLLEANPTVLQKVYLKGLKSGAKTPEVQAAATVAIAKLMLGRVVSESSAAVDDLLKTLVILYFDPSTVYNQGVRQTLSYFLPVFCYSRKENQDRMRRVSMDVMHKLTEVQESLEVEGDAEVEMVSLGTIGAHLVDWTDPRKCYMPGNQLSIEESAKKAVNGDVHLDFAHDILERLRSSTRQEEKKAISPLLAKLHISSASTEDKIRNLYDEVSEAVDGKLILDAPGRNALYKIHVSLGKIVNTLGGRKSLSPEDRTLAIGDEVTEIEEEEKTETVKMEQVGEEESTILGDEAGEGTKQDRDSLVDNLLSDGDVEMS
ncbi:hypothetical protein B7494_g4415 [Chlorociboria aeruginascens]|nr:hypothetical protein B7494_g4415 [Chlorociboria aeruginascens]